MLTRCSLKIVLLSLNHTQNEQRTNLVNIYLIMSFMVLTLHTSVDDHRLYVIRAWKTEERAIVVGVGVSFCGCGCENWCVCVFFVNLYCHRFTKKNKKNLLCTASGSDDHQPFRQVYFKWACLIFRQKNWPITACLIFQQKNWPITACLMS